MGAGRMAAASLEPEDMTESSQTPMAAEARAEIERRLAAIEAEEGVEVLFAVESGSRAWGFPSPDSDYDGRFVYRHPGDWYLSVLEARDVIERPILDDYDVNGWDLRKTLRLLLKSNPPLYEWLRSPVAYRDRDGFRAALRSLAEANYSLRTVGHHYRQTARLHHDGKPGPATRKRLLYCLRALLSLAWLKQQGSLPPMNVAELLGGLELPAGLGEALGALIAEKAQAPEKGEARAAPLLESWIGAELEAAPAVCDGLPVAKPDLASVEAFFRTWAGFTEP